MYINISARYSDSQNVCTTVQWIIRYLSKSKNSKFIKADHSPAEIVDSSSN